MENWNKFLNEEEVPAPLPAEEFEKIMADLKSDELNEGSPFNKVIPLVSRFGIYS